MSDTDEIERLRARNAKLELVVDHFFDAVRGCQQVLEDTINCAFSDLESQSASTSSQPRTVRDTEADDE